MTEENQDKDFLQKSQNQQGLRISPIRALQLKQQTETNTKSTDYDQTKPSLQQSDYQPQISQIDSPNKSVKFQNAEQPVNIKISSTPFGKSDINGMRKEFKRFKQNMNNSKNGLDQSYIQEEGKESEYNPSSTSKQERQYEMARIDKSLNNSQQSNNPYQSQNLSQQKAGQMHRSVNEAKKEMLRKNQEKMEQIKEQKREEKRQKIMEKNLQDEEKKNQRLLEERDKEDVLTKLEACEFYPAVNEMIEEMQLSFEDFVMVKRVNLLKKNTMQDTIINPLLERNPHINILTLSESLFAKLLRFMLRAIKMRTYILFILEWVWIITLIVVTGFRINHFNRDQLIEDASIQNKDEDEIITGNTIPVLLFIQAFLWILCNLAFLVSVVKCRIPFSTFHIIFHVGEIIMNIFTFALGMTVVYSNKNSSAIVIHFAMGILDFLFSFVSLLISKSINGYLKKFLILTNQYSYEEFQNTCC